MNISNGIIYTIKEQYVTDVLIGLHHDVEKESFLGHKAESILRRVLETVYIYKPLQPFNTLKRLMVAVPPKAELEPGFVHWLDKLCSIAKRSGLPLFFYASQKTLTEIRNMVVRIPAAASASYSEFADWEDLTLMTQELKSDDLFVIISSRKGYDSYNASLAKLPEYLNTSFAANGFIILYPSQLESGINMADVQHVDGQLLDTITEKIEAIGETGKKLFGKRRS
jgi:hypothetical protein